MKWIRKSAALLAAICLVLAAFTGMAEEIQVITMMPAAQNGAVRARDASDFSIDTLELGLLNGELKAGETAILTIRASGGKTPYTYSCRLTQKKADGRNGAISDTSLRMLVKKIIITERKGKLKIKIQLNADFSTHIDFLHDEGDPMYKSHGDILVLEK